MVDLTQHPHNFKPLFKPRVFHNRDGDLLEVLWSDVPHYTDGDGLATDCGFEVLRSSSTNTIVGVKLYQVSKYTNGPRPQLWPARDDPWSVAMLASNLMIGRLVSSTHTQQSAAALATECVVLAREILRLAREGRDAG